MLARKRAGGSCLGSKIIPGATIKDKYSVNGREDSKVANNDSTCTVRVAFHSTSMFEVWFITGVSSGLGFEMALQALQQGFRVIGTVRNKQRAAKEITAIEGAGGTIVVLDITDAEACYRVFAEADKIHGQIDVLVNNAGASYLGALEDFTYVTITIYWGAALTCKRIDSDEEVQAQMDLCFGAPYRLIRAALPSYRRRRTGTIVNISSSAGIDGIAACGLYAASKFALEGFSEALAREVEVYNVKVVIVEPGAFRTNFLGAYIRSKSTTNLVHYPAAQASFDKFDAWSGKQPGDTVKGAAAIVRVASGKGTNGPQVGKAMRLPLGNDCVARLEAKIKSMKDDLDGNRSLSESTNHDDLK
ncbi:hypothetical protein BDY17DRAFT_336368 [Neohortaea acidophila]|uniref:Uncharacterized protein n=1 Tax=Neohortaea acidophila TaxID=245834 RepID=A0A6A6PN81_9PEZI|nr:uncharacterized protein BDY17DRAFT_336368 [Neohortaea acidophila]KAF2481560.1 hypothetical protein BDY17DRAFT_336368 [Neohortaea acidophila]